MKIGLSLNRIILAEVQEQRDSIDVRWITLLQKLGHEPVLIPSDLKNPEDYFSSHNISGFILTGGNNISASGEGDAPSRERMERAMIAYAIQQQLPVLGVCRGMQHLNVYFDGTLDRVTGHVRKNHLVDSVDFFPKNFEVNSFHNFGINPKNLSPEFKVASVCKEDGTVESFSHQSLPFFGIMWHPERAPENEPSNLKFIQKIFGV